MSRKVEKKETQSEVVLHSLFANNDDVSCSALSYSLSAWRNQGIWKEEPKYNNEKLVRTEN